MEAVRFRLLIAAAVLMLLAGGIFGLLHLWLCAALIFVGSFGCMVAALNFKNHNDGSGDRK